MAQSRHTGRTCPLLTQSGLVAAFLAAAGVVAVEQSAHADGSIAVRAWGTNYWGQVNIPDDIGAARQICSSAEHSIALRSDGTVRTWGQNLYGACDIPAGIANVVQIDAGGNHNIALLNDGTVRCWGANDQGAGEVPDNLGLAIAVETGAVSIVIRADGSIRCWGRNNEGECNVPVGIQTVRMVTAGHYHNLALCMDGTVVCWGGFTTGSECHVPPDLGTVGRVAAGNQFSIVLEGDDIDSDGLIDVLDNCLSVSNTTQADCNSDGVGDACELAAGIPDFNGDTIPDTCQCLADLFVDRQVNGADLGVLLSQWGPANANTASDMNRDGRVDGADLGHLLASWGPCTN